MKKAEPTVHIAFRFHTNFYHSYRVDTPDELGFGLDIRIIRHTLHILDQWNDRGVPVKGTWDIDNAFTLGDIMPTYCPDIIQALQRRVTDGYDEINVMTYNNGLISAHTANEFDAAISKALHNEEKSGLYDVFSKVAPLVRPQEMMYTPLHLHLYPPHGIKAISLFYSGVPFNAFSNFIRTLSLAQRYNPLWLSYPDIEDRMALIPAYNHGDIADWLSLRRWVKSLHKQQTQMNQPQDFLLLLDADADDEFWEGYNVSIIKRILPITDGLTGLIQSVCDLPYVVFTTPYQYLKAHLPIATIQIGQDTADGSFDGYASWADKWSNHQLWTGIERSRILEYQARLFESNLAKESSKLEFYKALSISKDRRLRAMSTTHFGLTAPILNRTRLKIASQYVSESVRHAEKAFNIGLTDYKSKSTYDGDFVLFDYIRGISTQYVRYNAKTSRALMHLSLQQLDMQHDKEPSAITLQDHEGTLVPACIMQSSPHVEELLFTVKMEKLAHKVYTIVTPAPESSSELITTPVKLENNQLSNKWIALKLNDKNHITSFTFMGSEFADGSFIRSAVHYAQKIYQVEKWHVIKAQSLCGGLVGVLQVGAEIHLGIIGKPRVYVQHEFLLVNELPYLYLTTEIQYPWTESRNYNRKTAVKLGSRYDNHWREVMPCEIRPALFGTAHTPLRIWKHNYLGHISLYELDYGSYSRNYNIDSFNNHITNAWVAVNAAERGLLVAQTADFVANFAFCPMRLRTTNGKTRLSLNPFGTYFGKQWHYPTSRTGIGKFLATLMAPTLGPQAASYNGRSETIRLMIAPYISDRPAESLCADAEAFAYPYVVASLSGAVFIPSYRSWQKVSMAPNT